ncbi:unnamed protein product [Prorocentrum cordatum]|uniref:Uncharacterized protein n=1 Tax=Prorocentrum cordatum TaxID=2364126 RepID=A0ABN9UV61_9DINO|nr:unnamed protein product [Polarella glacialis]
MAAANAAVRRRGSGPRAAQPHYRERELPGPGLPWAPQLRQELEGHEEKTVSRPSRAGGAGGAAAAQRSGRRRNEFHEGQDPGARADLRQLGDLHAARGLLPEELSEPESQESAESISGNIASSWNPAVQEHRYRYARDRAVGFSEPWQPMEWTVQDWERHLGASGALATPAQRRAREESRQRYRRRGLGRRAAAGGPADARPAAGGARQARQGLAVGRLGRRAGAVSAAPSARGVRDGAPGRSAAGVMRGGRLAESGLLRLRSDQRDALKRAVDFFRVLCGPHGRVIEASAFREACRSEAERALLTKYGACWCCASRHFKAGQHDLTLETFLRLCFPSAKQMEPGLMLRWARHQIWQACVPPGAAELGPEARALALGEWSVLSFGCWAAASAEIWEPQMRWWPPSPRWFRMFFTGG